MSDRDVVSIPLSLRSRDTRAPKTLPYVDRVERAATVTGIVAAILRHGVGEVSTLFAWELGIVVSVAFVVILVGEVLRFAWSIDRWWHVRQNAFVLGVLGAWTVACIVVPVLAEFPGNATPAGDYFRLTEIALGLVALLHGVDATRRLAAGGRNPGFLLVATFVVLIAVGTTLLMLPGARRVEDGAERVGAPFRVAVFTATSASCVTGLIVVPTGSYWSDFGHIVILCLFQIGGLGIMTCGALVAATLGTRFGFREVNTLGNLLDAESVGATRTLLKTIFVATLTTELVGGLVLSTLWPDLPVGRRLFQGFFHSTSAFCNAGFSLEDDGFLGWGTRWQVTLAVPALIVAGGLGFAVTYNVWLWIRTSLFGSAPHHSPLFHFPGERVRLTLGTKLVLATTATLLVVGTFGYYLLEAPSPVPAKVGERWCDAWFQSVTFRTAGFNTVDHGDQQPATKLFAMVLMFVGASPGSTGGGIKTTTCAIAVLAVAAALRGHARVDVGHRTVPAGQVTRALTVIALGLTALVGTILMLLVFEGEGHHDFLDLCYEATSATATVGVSTGLTGELRPPSQYVLMVAMFLGRVGPLTLLLALAGRRGDVRYQYPEEPVSLG